MSEHNSNRPLRTVRSFVRRQGRVSANQRLVAEQLWPRYVIPNEPGVLDLDRVFGRQAPRTLEIGFGMGEGLLALAQANPERDFLGIEVHGPGVGALIRRLDEHAITNVRIINDDAVLVLSQRIADASFDQVLLMFADPWPKKRHHKRRIVQPEFVQLIRRKLRPGGSFRLATDWEDYAQHMLDVLSAAEGLTNVEGPGQFAPRPPERPLTKFEQRGQRLGHGVWDLIFRRDEGGVDS